MARKSRKAENIVAAPEIIEAIWNTALYARLSVMDSGKKDGESILNQQEMLQNYVAEHPELVEKRVFVDNGKSGVDFLRPAWNDLMNEVRNGNINCIVVKDLSRIGRSYLEVGEYLEKIFPLLGVRVIAVNDGYDSLTLTTGGRLVSNLKNLVNDIYAKDISRKVSAAIHTKQSNGEFIGSSAAYGYMKDPTNKNKIIVNPDTAPIVRQIFEWKAEGLGNGAICQKLNNMGVPCPNRYRYLSGKSKNEKHKDCIWIIPTVAGILRNPLYLGHMTQGKWREDLCAAVERHKTKRDEWIIVPNTHEAIVSQDLFDRALAVFDNRAEEYLRNRYKYSHEERSELVLYGLVYCADCGYALSRKKNRSGKGQRVYWTYGCKKELDLHACSKKNITEEDLYGAVYEAIKAEVLKACDIDEIIKKLNRENSHRSRLASFDAEIEEAEHEIRRIAALRQAVYEDYATKLLTMSEYKFATEKYDADTEKLKMRLELARREKTEYTQHSTPVNKWLAAFTRFMDEKELTADMARALIERIEVSERNRISITFKFRDEFAAICKYAEVV